MCHSVTAPISIQITFKVAEGMAPVQPLLTTNQPAPMTFIH